MRFGRRRPDVAGLEPVAGDRLLESSEVVAGDGAAAVAVATTSALVLLQGGREVWRRPWHELDRGEWDGDARLLDVTGVDGWSARLALGPGARLRLAVAVRDRVQASVVATRFARVGSGPLVRVVVRQVLGGPDAGRLVVQELAPSDVRVEGELAAAVASVRTELEEAVGLA